MSVCHTTYHQLIAHFMCLTALLVLQTEPKFTKHYVCKPRGKSLHQFPLLKVLEAFQAITVCWASDVT
jgi:hypothetical protein